MILETLPSVDGESVCTLANKVFRLFSCVTQEFELKIVLNYCFGIYNYRNSVKIYMNIQSIH